MSRTWRVGGKVPLNVYEGDKPMFQCHTPEDAARIVGMLNALPEAERTSLQMAREALKGVMPFVGGDAEFSIGEYERYHAAVNAAKAALTEIDAIFGDSQSSGQFPHGAR